VERTGTDLCEVDLLVGSGGVLRAADPTTRRRILGIGQTAPDSAAGWQLPRDPAVAVDSGHVLAAAGLLAAEHPVAAHGLVSRLASSVA
jgi:hypothetical protein